MSVLPTYARCDQSILNAFHTFPVQSFFRALKTHREYYGSDSGIERQQVCVKLHLLGLLSSKWHCEPRTMTFLLRQVNS